MPNLSSAHASGRDMVLGPGVQGGAEMARD